MPRQAPTRELCVAVTSLMAASPDVAGGHPSQGLSAWVNVEAIKLLTHHTSAVIAALVLFWLVGFIATHLMHDGPIKRAVVMVDEFTLLCLFIFFAYELIRFL